MENASACLWRDFSATMSRVKQRNAYCSFCRKSYTDVGPLVEGPGEVYICGGCIELSQDIVCQEQRRRHRPKRPDATDLHQKLDRLMSGQEEAKRALTLVLGPREGRLLILLTGLSPAAKVLLSRAVAHLVEVPFAKGNASDLLSSHESTAGLPPLLFSLLKESDFDLDLAQRGLVYVEGAESPDCQHAILEFCHTDNFEPHGRIPFDPADILLVCGATSSRTINSDNLARLDGLTNASSGAYINNATVTFTMLDINGNTVTNGSMTFVAASNGRYEGTIGHGGA
jgi:hypothetical protein